MMKILADDNMPWVTELFGAHAEIRRMPGRQIQPQHLQHQDVLLVRSVTRVTPELLAGSRVAFVGSATIGTDHLALDYLQSQGLGWANAPGCNAQAVVQYVLAALVELKARGKLETVKTASVIGVGQVGSRVARLLRALGFDVWCCDPPRAEREGQAGFVSLSQALEADLICLHAPLVRDGPYASRHLLDAAAIAGLKPGTLVLNAGRGELIDTQALAQRLQAQADLAVVLDVWEQEPQVPPDLASKVQIATPHIAGYSLEGKVRGTQMVYQAFCQHFGLTPVQPSLTLPPLPLEQVGWSTASDRWQRLQALVPLTYDLRADDGRLRASLDGGPQQQAQAFDRLRKDYPLRRELSALQLQGPDADWFAGLGFGLSLASGSAQS